MGIFGKNKKNKVNDDVELNTMEISSDSNSNIENTEVVNGNFTKRNKIILGVIFTLIVVGGGVLTYLEYKADRLVWVEHSIDEHDMLLEVEKERLEQEKADYDKYVAGDNTEITEEIIESTEETQENTTEDIESTKEIQENTEEIVETTEDIESTKEIQENNTEFVESTEVLN